VQRLVALLLASLVAVAACQAVGGPERLVADLQAVGLAATLGRDQDAGLLGGVATVVCVGDESVSVYTFEDAGAALQAAATVNKRDPWNVGNAVVEWIGPPRFWMRDRVIVLYVGAEPAVDSALRTILGRPFAESRDGGRGLPAIDQLPCR
jgi:hypothetical protein